MKCFACKTNSRDWVCVCVCFFFISFFYLFSILELTVIIWSAHETVFIHETELEILPNRNGQINRRVKSSFSVTFLWRSNEIQTLHCYKH